MVHPVAEGMASVEVCCGWPLFSGNMDGLVCEVVQDLARFSGWLDCIEPGLQVVSGCGCLEAIIIVPEPCYDTFQVSHGPFLRSSLSSRSFLHSSPAPK